MAEEADDKKHEPTEKRWREASEKGQIPKSADLGAAVGLFAGATALVFGSGPAVNALRELMERFLRPGSHRLEISEATDISWAMLTAITNMLWVPMSALVIGALVAGIVQSQGAIATKALEPDWNRVNPLDGFKQKYMSWTPVVELGKGLGKLVLLAGAAGLAVYAELDTLPAMSTLHPAQLIGVLAELGWTMIVACLPLILAIAAADYAYAWWKINQQLMLTDKELRDEFKEQEGDPQMRARRRAMGRQFATGSMLAAIADAEVVVTNPTHFAVALRYRRDQDGAPVVVARGLDHLALKIRGEAMRHGIPRVEDRPLARALYRRVRLGEPIPEDLFVPVARVLAVVYKRRAARKQRSEGSSPPLS